MTNQVTKCSNCGSAATGRFCDNCGAALPRSSCPSCGASLTPGNKFCPECGGAIGLTVVSVDQVEAALDALTPQTKKKHDR